MKKPRGLAAVPLALRQEIARKGGLAIGKDKAHMTKIGKLGAKNLVSSAVEGHFEALGAKGGRSLVEKYGKEYMSKLGRKGGAVPRVKKVKPCTPAFHAGLDFKVCPQCGDRLKRRAWGTAPEREEINAYNREIYRKRRLRKNPCEPIREYRRGVAGDELRAAVSNSGGTPKRVGTAQARVSEGFVYGEGYKFRRKVRK